MADAYETRELYVLHAACHNMTAEDEFVVGESSAQDAAAFDGYDFTVVLLSLFIYIPVPLGVIHVVYGEAVRVYVVRQRVGDIVRFHVVGAVLVENLALSVGAADYLVVRHFIKAVGAAVENHYLRAL